MAQAPVLDKTICAAHRSRVNAPPTVPTLRLIGLPTDSHSSFLRGAARAPERIRAALFSDHTNLSSESGVELGTDVLLTDAGDLPLNESDADAALISEAVAAAVREGAVPLALTE